MLNTTKKQISVLLTLSLFVLVMYAAQSRLQEVQKTAYLGGQVAAGACGISSLGDAANAKCTVASKASGYKSYVVPCGTSIGSTAGSTSGVCVGACCLARNFTGAGEAATAGGMSAGMGSVLGQVLGQFMQMMMGGGGGGGSDTGTGDYQDMWGNEEENVTTYVCSDGTEVSDSAFCPLGTTAVAEIDNTDSDGDGVIDSVDNCDYVANPDQADADADGIGTVCDTDESSAAVSTTTATTTASAPVAAAPLQFVPAGGAPAYTDAGENTTTYVRLNAVKSNPVVGGQIVRTPTIETVNTVVDSTGDSSGLSRGDLEWQGLEELARRKLDGEGIGADYPYGALSDEERKALQDYHKSAIAVSGDLNPFSGNPLSGDRYAADGGGGAEQPGWFARFMMALLALLGLN